MNRRKIIIILILLISLGNIEPIIQVKAIDSVVGHYVIEKQISAYSDDAFLFVNTYFTNSTTAIPLNNNQYDIMIGLRFQDVGLNAPTSTTYETIETCRLSFYTTDDYPVESGDTWLTIYGIKDSGDVPTFSSYQDMVDRELYFDHYNNVNFNELVGDGEWWNTTDIRVSTRNIVKTTEKDIGFIMYAESGGASRLFRTYEHNASLAVKLYIMVFQWEIYEPEEQDDYVETYRDLYIHSIQMSGTEDYVWSSILDGVWTIYYDDVDGSGPYSISQPGDAGTTATGQRCLVKTSDEKLYIVYQGEPGDVKQIYVKESVDAGLNWVNEVLLSQPNMDAENHYMPAIAIDSNDYLHVVWYGKSIGINQIYYVNYTGSWSTPLDISIEPCRDVDDQKYPVIAVDSNDYLHIIWSGESEGFGNFQIQYMNYTGSWSTPFRISISAGMDAGTQIQPSIAIDSENHVHVVWWGISDAYPVNKQVWYRNKNIAWESIVRISTYSGMQNDHQTTPSIAIDSDDYPHVVWTGWVSAVQDDQIWENHYNGTDWNGTIDISTHEDNNGALNINPSITIAPNSTYYVVWKCLSKIYQATYIVGWNTPIMVQDIGDEERLPVMRYPLIYTMYVVKDENGTTVSPVLPSIQDAKEWINDYLAHSGGGVGEGMGDLVIALMGLAGFIMIPLSFIIFIQNMQSGDVENAFYMLMVLFFMGIAFIANWLWG